MLGPESEYGIAIALLLSTNYVLQTWSNKARELQKKVLESAKRYFGPDHPKTLQIMDTFGATCLMCSRLREANQLHQEVIDKLSKMEGFDPEHENTLTAIDNLAKVKLRYFDFKTSLKLQLQAYEGMRKILDPTHAKTLEAQDNLAGIYGFKGEEYLPLALQMIEEVTRIRIETLGKEHPFTLKSKLTEAKIRTAMDQFEEAERIFKDGLPAAERNLGESHLGTLTARTWLGHLYWRQERYADAEAVWEDVVKKHHYEEAKRADGEHLDRVQAIWFLVHCYEDQGRIDEALKMCEEVGQLVHDFGGEGLGLKHKFWQLQLEKKEELLKLKEQAEKDGVANDKATRLPSGQSTDSPSLVRPKKVVKDFTF